jgi:hypothetical protein
MVFQEEARTSWLWPLRRSASDEKAQLKQGLGPYDQGSPGGSDGERAFDIADAMEMGLARELVTDFVSPLRRSGKLWKFKVHRSEDRLQYRLKGDDGSFLMYARSREDTQRVEFFLYDPLVDGSLFDSERPAFTMSRNYAKTEWRIVQEAHDNRSPKTCSPCVGRPDRREVALIRHTRRNIGSGVNYVMDISLPATDGNEGQSLTTKAPEWNADVASLVLDFKGRRVLSSAKNFQLSPEDKPSHVACQFGKLGPNCFGLDFRFPLTVIQAFGISMTTICWT